MTESAGETAVAEEGSRSRLGRGLAALIGDVGGESPVERPRGQRRLPIGSLRPNARNPRRVFAADELDELAASLRERGIIQPIVVRPLRGAADTHEIIAGERRWRAAQRAGLHEVPVVVIEATDAEALQLAIIENVQRADLNPLEEAEGYRALMDEFGNSQEDDREDGRQEPKLCRQYATASEAARAGEDLYSRRQTRRRARAHAGRRRRMPKRWRRKSSPAISMCAQVEAMARERAHKSGKKQTNGSHVASNKDADTLLWRNVCPMRLD